MTSMASHVQPYPWKRLRFCDRENSLAFCKHKNAAYVIRWHSASSGCEKAKEQRQSGSTSTFSQLPQRAACRYSVVLRT